MFKICIVTLLGMQWIFFHELIELLQFLYLFSLFMCLVHWFAFFDGVNIQTRAIPARHHSQQLILEWKKVPCILKIAAGGTQLPDCVRRPRYRVLDYAHLPGGFSLGRALALFDMPLPSHLSHPGTCYLGDSNIHFLPNRLAVCLCLIVSPSLLFSLTLAHTRAHAHMHTHSKGSPRLSSPLSRSLSLLSLSLSPSICWESLRQLRSDTAALQTKEGAARSTATYLVCYTQWRQATMDFWHLFIGNAAVLFHRLEKTIRRTNSQRGWEIFLKC